MSDATAAVWGGSTAELLSEVNNEMSKNIVIFSDGTGQRGGVLVDERRSNIYKLYRATRCGPDSSVDPANQLTFYDPGIGTHPEGRGTLGSIWAWLYNLVSQALGLGLTANMVDCYAVILRLWRPGDRIFLFGFSRGAYTARCLGGVLGLCGVPTRIGNAPLRYDEATSQRIAREAVVRVYQHTSSRKEEKASDREKVLLAQRRELARRFRDCYESSNGAEGPNVHPHFIGVFDTVASLSNPVALAGLIGTATLALLGAGALVWWLVPSYWPLFVALIGLAAVLAIAAHLWTRVRFEHGLPGANRWGFHLTEARMRFYDKELNPKVAFARHAISIDERRASFERVTWGVPRQWKASEPPWFEQVWFAGNHSDVGGSYPEEESRLSDIALAWMRDAAVAAGLEHDPALLKLFPDPAGPQHDEAKSSLFRFAATQGRKPKPDAPLHPTVLKRFEESAVLNYDVMEPYRPACLRDHDAVAHFYAADELIAQHGENAPDEAERRSAQAQARGDEEEAKRWKRVRDLLQRGSPATAAPGSPPSMPAARRA